MASEPTGALKAWEYPKKSGIRIREVLNNHSGQTFGGSYLVTVPSKITGRLKKRRQFKNKASAEAWADTTFTGYRKQGNDFFSITEQERQEIGSCLPQLRKQGVSIGEAIRFAVKHLRPEGRTKTIQQIVDELVASKSQRHDRGDLRERSYRDFRHRGEKFASGFAGRIASEVTGQEIKEWLNGMKLGSRTNKNYLSIVGEVFKFATQKHYVAFSPLDDLTDVDRKELSGRAGNVTEPSILTAAEAARLINGAWQHPELGLLGAVTLGLFCGLRTEELKRLEWNHVRLSEVPAIITIGAKIAKKRRIRHVEIPANAVSWLSLVADRTGQLTRNDNSSDYLKRFRRLLRFAGFGKTDAKEKWISTWENNAMRHSFGSYHYALHGNPLETSRQLGHKASDQVLFDHYRALATKTQAEAYFAIKPPASAANIVRFA